MYVSIVSVVQVKRHTKDCLVQPLFVVSHGTRHDIRISPWKREKFIVTQVIDNRKLHTDRYSAPSKAEGTNDLKKWRWGKAMNVEI